MPELLATDQLSETQIIREKSRQLLELRAEVFALWEEQVREEVHGAEDVAGPILIDTLPLLYGNIIEALCPDNSRENATVNTTAAAGHGVERARSTNYQVDELVHEYQVLREVLVAVCKRHGLLFDTDEMLVISRSFDLAIRISVREFNATHSAFREQIAATLTHDMRTPLSVILGAAQLIAKQAEVRTTKLAKMIVDNGLRLETMLSQQLDALDKGLLGVTCLNLSHWSALKLAQQVSELLTFCNDRRCEVFGEVVNGWWDRNLLQRALENLVGNALKYGTSDGVVTIKVGEALGRVFFSVHNIGNPIPGERQNQIFRYLNRNEINDQDGWGIGLPFVQDIAIRHGGTVVIDSSEAAGTTFTIDIPCDARVINSKS